MIVTARGRGTVVAGPSASAAGRDPQLALAASAYVRTAVTLGADLDAATTAILAAWDDTRS